MPNRTVDDAPSLHPGSRRQYFSAPSRVGRKHAARSVQRVSSIDRSTLMPSCPADRSAGVRAHPAEGSAETEKYCHPRQCAGSALARRGGRRPRNSATRLRRRPRPASVRGRSDWRTPSSAPGRPARAKWCPAPRRDRRCARGCQALSATTPATVRWDRPDDENGCTIAHTSPRRLPTT
jgi:hypothetical protein